MPGSTPRRPPFNFTASGKSPGLATADETPFSGEIEVDESCFGGVRKGKRDRGAAGKTPVLGLLKRGGKVYARVIPDVKRRTLIGIIQDKVVPDSIVYSDSYPVYDVLDVSSFKHFRINHSRILPMVAITPNGIENFCQSGEAQYA